MVIRAKHLNAPDLAARKSLQDFEIIQQWQYTGSVAPELLTDNAFEACRRFGITSLQSYVHWSEVEKSPGDFDFSAYDPLVAKLAQHDLKWVPFLISGTHYGTPQWFQDSTQSIFARCLEHDRSCGIQSIWNPHLPAVVEKFFDAVSRHFHDYRILESVALGISGNWGESIFPAHGGFGSRLHCHPGWWCGDRYARKSFRRSMLEIYGGVAAINRSWGTSFSQPEDIDFPQVHSSLKEVYNYAVRLIPRRLKPVFKKIKRFGSAQLAKRHQHPGANITTNMSEESRQKKCRWLDFSGWYTGSMTNWAEFCLRTARGCFPDQKIYLVTGGEGEPILGADQSAQAKLAARYKAGIRTTNQTDTYADSFIRTRLIASACRNYGTYFTTEEAGVNCSTGVTMRIFDAVSSGAEGLYFKSLMVTGDNPCGSDNTSPGLPTEGAENMARHFDKFGLGKPLIDVVVLYPQTTIQLNPFVLDDFYRKCSELRCWMDFDVIDENMIKDGLLSNYRSLAVVCGGWLPANTIAAISDWMQSGGILVAGTHTPFKTLGENDRLWNSLFEPDNGTATGMLHSGSPKSYFKFIQTAATHVQAVKPGMYRARLQNHTLRYDSRKHTIHVEPLHKRDHSEIAC